MSKPKATYDVDRLLGALSNGAGIDTAAALVGTVGRTVQRHQATDPVLAGRIARARERARRLLKANICGELACYRAGCRCPRCTAANAEHCRRTAANRRAREAR